jgi:branched-chain amino acid transport system permease protein
MTTFSAARRKGAGRGARQAVAAVAVLTGLAALAAVEALGSRILVSLLAQSTLVSLLALSVGFLLRTSGLVSFGHAAPFGLGAYGAAWAVKSGSPVPPEIGLLLVPPVVAAIFFLVGLVISRLEGIAFGMLTLALGQMVYVAADKFRDLTGGSDGMSVDLPLRLFGLRSDVAQNPHGMLVISLGAVVLVYLALSLFEKAHAGRLAAAIRENEERTRFLGYRVRALKAGVLGLSAAVAAVGGVLYALYQGFVSPEIMHWTFSGSALIMAILGGASALWGPVLGAFAFFFIREGLTDYTSHWLFILGAALVLVTIAWPGGLAGAVLALVDRAGRKLEEQPSR